MTNKKVEYYYLTDNGQGHFDYPSESLIKMNGHDDFEFLEELKDLWDGVVETSVETDEPNCGDYWYDALPFWVENYTGKDGCEKFLSIVAKHYGIDDCDYEEIRNKWLKDGYLVENEYVAKCKSSYPEKEFSITVNAISVDEVEQLIKEINDSIKIKGRIQKTKKGV